MFPDQFFNGNAMEVFLNVQEVIFMVQVDELTKDKEEHIMYVLSLYRAHAVIACSPIFKDKSVLTSG